MSGKCNPSYTCPRCNYTTSKKTYMYKHLFTLKRICPGHKSSIELTEEIKQYILTNRIYVVPKPVDPIKVFKQTINYNNTMNNFIANMDTVEKLQKVLQYQNRRSLPFNTHVEKALQCNVEELKKRDSDVLLSNNDILELVGKVSLIGNAKMEQPLEAFSILYDTKLKSLKTSNDNGSWNEYLLHKGIQMVIQAIKEVYLDDYEVALIQKMENSCFRSRAHQELSEILESYYKFLACFELMPIVEAKKDRDLLYERWSREWSECAYSGTGKADQYMKIYNKIKEGLLQRDIITLHKNAVAILKLNTMKNIDDLNKMVIGLFTNDEAFKNLLTKNEHQDNQYKKEERDISFYKELYEDSASDDND